MSIKRIAPLLIFVLLLAIPLALIITDTVRAVVVIPLLYVIWLGNLVLQSIPQLFWWGLLITLALFTAIRNLGPEGKSSLKIHRAQPMSPGRVAMWTKRVGMASHGSYYQWRLAHELGLLGLELLVYHEQPTAKQTDHNRGLEKLNAPPEIQAYFHAGLKPPFSSPTSLLSRLLQYLRSETYPKPLELNPEKAVRFLEEQLEAQSDN